LNYANIASDCGVARILKGLSKIEENSADFGQAFEHFILLEIKASNKISEKHFLGLKALKEEKIIKKYYIVSQDKINRKTNDGVELILAEFFGYALGWTDFLKSSRESKTSLYSN